ncbi:MAG: hypothetical protein PHY12_11630 [Eubacteriales bacterium]|nr:hypothetical protein [Eubacteriales bacterium]
MLEGFKPYIIASGQPTITFTKNGVGVSKAAIETLGGARYARILFDTENKRMAIQVCDKDDRAANDFSKSEKLEGIRWNSRNLVTAIKEITGWTTDGDEKYVMEGVLESDDQYPALIFDFAGAKVNQ